MFFDTHAHLGFPDFAQELPAILERARAAGITRIVTIGTNLENSRQAVRLAEANEMVYAAVGWHPSDAMEAPEDVRPALREMARHPKVVAIGETGLDYYRLPSKMKGASLEEDERYKAKQAQLFAQQLEVASELGLNCVVHQRSSLEDTIQQIAPWCGKLKAVFHCFVEPPEVRVRLAEMGILVSFTGVITFKNAEIARETVRQTPAGGFMLETDCPFLAPVPYRGKRCEPAYTSLTAAAVAEIRGCTLQELSETTCATARNFFPKMA